MGVKLSFRRRERMAWSKKKSEINVAKQERIAGKNV